MAHFVAGQPIKRPLPMRLLLTVFLSFLYVWKKLRLPRAFWGRQIRAIFSNWTDPMLKLLIRTRIQRAYPDQTCELRFPENYEPQVEVEERYRLSEDEIKTFWQRGFLDPIQVFSPEEMAVFGEELKAVRGQVSPTYGFVTDRDHHLDMPSMWRKMQHPAIVERVAQLLGPDLMVWRSQFFFKKPGAPAIAWHQESTYMVEDYLEPAIVPPDRDGLFMVTVWVAVDHAHKANGCLKLIPGSACRIHPITFGGREGIYDVAKFTVDYEFKEEDVAYIECKPGQAIILLERTVHGSSANTTDGTRSAFNCRIVRPDTKVYPDKTYHCATQLSTRFPLDKYGCVMLRGKDKFGLNRMAEGARERAPA